VDEYILHDSVGLRGRAVREVPELLAANLPDGVAHEIVDSYREGLHLAARRVRPGERLIVIPETVDDSLEELQRAMGAIGEESVCTSPISTTVTA
jgi:hypothetical protein